MSKWIEFSTDERKAMIQGVVNAMHIDEAAAEKDWWVTAVLYALFHTKPSEYLLFKGGTSLSKRWNIIDRFSEDIDLALERAFFLNEKNLACAHCTSNTQIHKLRENAQDYLFGEFKEELKEQLTALGLDVKVFSENEFLDENGQAQKVDHDKELPSTITIVPREDLIPQFEADYKDMRSSFIYGKSLNFSDLLQFIEMLQEKFRKVPEKTTK